MGQLDTRSASHSNLQLWRRFNDGAETTSAYEGSVLPPKKLSDLTVIIAREEMQRDGVCVAITLEPTSVKKNFYFACGRKLTSASEGALCGRHKQFPYSCGGANVGKIYEWGDGQYAAVCPENGCAYIYEDLFREEWRGERVAACSACRIYFVGSGCKPLLALRVTESDGGGNGYNGAPSWSHQRLGALFGR